MAQEKPTLHIPYRVTIHCTDTPNGKEVSVEAIRADHIKKFETFDIGYHAIIQPSGQVVDGRSPNYRGAHVSGANTGNLGVCLAGKDLFSRVQFSSLRRILNQYVSAYPIEKWSIFLHSQFKTAQEQGKTCPNIDANRFFCWFHLLQDAAISPYLIENKKATTLEKE